MAGMGGKAGGGMLGMGQLPTAETTSEDVEGSATDASEGGLESRVQKLALEDDEVERVLAAAGGGRLLELKAGSFVDVLVSYFTSRNEWCVQPSCCKAVIENLCMKMNVFFGQSGNAAGLVDDVAGMPMGPPERISSQELAVGCTKLNGKELAVYCAAPYTDGCYYRCRVIGRASPKEFKLFYVDYGNEFVVPMAKIYKLPAEFRVLPPFAVRVQLNPEIKEEVGVEFLKELAAGIPLILKIVEQKGPTEVSAKVFMVEDGVQYDYVDVVRQAWMVEQNEDRLEP